LPFRPPEPRAAASPGSGRWIAPLTLAFQEADTTIEQRLFRGLALVGGLMAILVIVPTNLLQNTVAFVNWAVFVFGAACLLLFAATFRGHYGTKLLFFLHMVNLDFVWFGNGGSQGTIEMFLLTAAMYLVIFFKGRTRWLMLGFYLLNGVALLWVERLHPGWVVPYVSPEARFLDFIIGFVLCSVVCVLILWLVLGAYHRERERLGESLAAQSASEARFKSLVMNAPIPICVSSTQGTIEYVNQSFERVLGYTVQDLPDLGTWWEKAYPDPDLRRRAAAHWAEACALAVASGLAVPPTEYPVVCKDGRTAQLEIQASIIGDQWLVTFSDISERRRSEEALRQTQKLESLGILAGGIAHDFNNLLGAMLGNLNLAQMKLPAGAASGRYLDNLESTIGKAVELTRQMLAYSGKGRFVVEPLDLNRHVGEISHLLAVSISKRVRLEYAFAPDLPAIEADSAQLQQVVMNLVTNASEAIGDTDGLIVIATGCREIDAQEAATAFAGQQVVPGRYVTLRVSDTGCGMKPEVLARIFDPFFSTKGSGRGLGLSAMLGILRGHQAAIEIRTAPGGGSDFRVHFRASLAAVPGCADAASGARRVRFHGKVLLVDDEADLRASFAGMLEHLGFQVVAARDGFEALERFRPGEFALVLMDLTMPRMDGKEAFLQMQARDPALKVVLASGYSELEAIEPMLGIRPAGFIQKPFSLQELAAALEKALG
jgi:PAS domain S-box-containing protein